ncbi:MAG: metallophosphoesterase family protein [Candidatus Limnocylindrales bacterium]
MPRLLHLADVGLGARHVELGAAGSAQRERHWQAFEAALDLAAREHCDLVLIAGNLFASNTQPRGSLERAARDLGHLVAAGTAVAILPGDSDRDEAGSLYRTYDLAALGGLPPGTDDLRVLTPWRPALVIPALDLAVRGYWASAGQSLDEALGAPAEETETGVRLRVGVARGRVGATEGATVSARAVGEAGLNYLALGGAPAPAQGQVGSTWWADPGPTELPGDAAGEVGKVLLVTLDPAGSGRVAIETRPVGRSRRVRLELPAAGFADRETLRAHLATLADGDLACEVHLTGSRPPGLQIEEAGLEAELGPRFLHLRVLDDTLPPLPEPLPPAESISGAFARALGERIAAAHAEGRTADEVELREQLDLGMRILADSTGMPV